MVTTHASQPSHQVPRLSRNPSLLRPTSGNIREYCDTSGLVTTPWLAYDDMYIYIYTTLLAGVTTPFRTVKGHSYKGQKILWKEKGKWDRTDSLPKVPSVICHDVTVGQIWPQQNNTSICSGQYQKKGSETAVPSGLNPCKKRIKLHVPLVAHEAGLGSSFKVRKI